MTEVKIDGTTDQFISVPFSCFSSTGLHVVEAIAPEVKALTGKPEAVVNAENRVSKIIGERVKLSGFNTDTCCILFKVL